MQLSKPELPPWLQQPETSRVPSTGSRFLARNLHALQHMLMHFNQPRVIQHSRRSAWVELVHLLALVLVTVTCHNVLLLWGLGLLFLGELVLMPAAQIGGYLRALLKTLVVALVISLPSLLWLNPTVAMIWVAKICLVMGSVQIFRHRTTWAELLVGLRQLHVPSLFVLTLDITIKYSHVLGARLQETLQSVQLRSCGTPPQPLRLSGAVLGRLYLTSRSEANELYAAMQLRGYTGASAKVAWQWQRRDWRLLAGDCALVAVAIGFALR